MYLVNQTQLDRYLDTDVVGSWLDRYSFSADEELVCQRWLRQTPAKRFIASMLYGDLLTCSTSMRVLDVGGGLTSLSRELASRHQYVLADLLAHDDMTTAATMMGQVGVRFVHAQDWSTLASAPYDLIVANDIFPNVDQRLEMFLQQFLPHTSRMRLSLTYYDTPRFYKTRRVDADEILHMLAWNGAHLRSVLTRYARHVQGADFDIFADPDASVFPNGRQVCIVELKGGPLNIGSAT